MQLMIGTRKGLFVLSHQAGGLKINQTAFVGEPVLQTLVDVRDGAWYASLALGHFGPKLHRSTDAGSTWTELPTPSLPPKPDSGPFKGDPTPWSVERVWALVAGGIAQPQRLWAATMPAAVFVSNDGGQSWALGDSFWHDERRLQWMGGGNDHPAAHTLVVDPADADHAIVAISCGGIWRTRNAGHSWQLAGRGFNAEFMPPEMASEPNVQDPHRLSSCAAAPHVVWCQLHGGIYRSTDFAEHFTRCAKVPDGVGDFGFAIAACPVNPQRAWVVPATADTHRYAPNAAMCVARTDDAGQSWQVFRNGLPQQHAYDLIYRHGLAVSADGQQLAMASTTGNLWTSSDAGGSWQHVSAHLPPVNCLAWV